MNSYASIDISYELIERVERQRRRLAIIVAGAFIPAMLGLAINTYLFLLFSHQKSPSNGQNALLISILFIPCVLLLAVAVHKFVVLKKYNKKTEEIASLEDTIYREVLKDKWEILGKIDP